MNNAKWIIVAGIAIVLIGCILYFFPNAFKWFGKLPGDINIQRENSRFFFPITSMIIVSIVFSILSRVFRQFM